MRIAQVIDSLNFGGAQKLQVVFASALQHHPQVQLTVICLRQDHGTPFPQEIRAAGSEVVTFASASPRALTDLGRIRRLFRFLKGQKFDIVHTHLLYANILGTLTSEFAGIPAVASLHNERYAPTDSGAKRTLETWVLKRFSRELIAVGHAVAAAQAGRFHPRRLTVVPNAVIPIPPLEQSERKSVRQQVMGEVSRPVLVSVGGLNPQKGYGDLLRAFAFVRRDHPQAALWIVGGGRLYGELQAQVREMGLEGHAFLLGARDDVPRLLAASDLYVSASLWEGLPIAVLEAMAAGLTVIATDVGDVPRVVVEGVGLVVPPRQPELLAKAISTLLDDRPRMSAMGEAARRHVRRTYGAREWAERLLNLYRRVVEGDGRRA